MPIVLSSYPGYHIVSFLSSTSRRQAGRAGRGKRKKLYREIYKYKAYSNFVLKTIVVFIIIILFSIQSIYPTHSMSYKQDQTQEQIQ